MYHTARLLSCSTFFASTRKCIYFDKCVQNLDKSKLTIFISKFDNWSFIICRSKLRVSWEYFHLLWLEDLISLLQSDTEHRVNCCEESGRPRTSDKYSRQCCEALYLCARARVVITRQLESKDALCTGAPVCGSNRRDTSRWFNG